MIIGIDSGLDGAICIMGETQSEIIFELHRMPTLSITAALKGKALAKAKKEGKPLTKQIKEIDPTELAGILDKYPDTKVYIEDVVSFFGLPASSNFRLGYSIGVIHSVLRVLEIPYHLVKPKAWQKAIWIDSDIVLREKVKESIKQSKTDTKATSLNAALRIFPDVSFISKGCRVPSDGLIDAALIAHYGGLQ